MHPHKIRSYKKERAVQAKSMFNSQAYYVVTHESKKVNSSKNGRLRINATINGTVRGSSIYLPLLAKSRQSNPI